MLNLDKYNLKDYKVTIDENKLNQILDTAISKDFSLVVGKLPVEEPKHFVSEPISVKSNDYNNSNVLALTVRGDYNVSIVKNAFFKTLRMSVKVAFSTFFLNLIRIFLA